MARFLSKDENVVILKQHPVMNFTTNIQEQTAKSREDKFGDGEVWWWYGSTSSIMQLETELADSNL